MNLENMGTRPELSALKKSFSARASNYDQVSAMLPTCRIFAA